MKKMNQLSKLFEPLQIGPMTVPNRIMMSAMSAGPKAAAGLLIRPNVQYIYSPGGSSATENVWVLGLKTIVSF
jgi:2,4-dienoyl-CoA reductase-like NADH-dependent reductase (Old Yellow Enzyme family)